MLLRRDHVINIVGNVRRTSGSNGRVAGRAEHWLLVYAPEVPRRDRSVGTPRRSESFHGAWARASLEAEELLDALDDAEIVDGAEKKRVVLEVCELMGIEPGRAIAVGDGANDLPMMGAVGLSIAYHPKPAVQALAMISIVSGGMDRALEVLRV